MARVRLPGPASVRLVPSSLARGARRSRRRLVPDGRAQWLLVSHPHASILVSLVQVATTLPYVLFGLVAGVLADTLDRRLILISVQATVAGLGAVLAALTFAHLMPPALLLLLVFLLGTGAALGTPAYQSLVPELVPRDEIPAASALNSISVKVARALGPAIAGVLVATAGVGTTCTVGAASAGCYAVVVALWRPTSTERPRLSASSRPSGPARVTSATHRS
jgi:MFS family permease